MEGHLWPNDEQGNRRILHKTRTKQPETNTSSYEDMPMDSELSDGIPDEDHAPEADLQQAPSVPPELIEVPQTPGSITPDRRRSKRVRTNITFGADQEDCAEMDCDDPSSQEEKIKCAGPGCNANVCAFFVGLVRKLTEDSQYHLSCVGLDAAPIGGWFCDADCRTNAGQRIAPVCKRRRVIIID